MGRPTASPCPTRGYPTGHTPHNPSPSRASCTRQLLPVLFALVAATGGAPPGVITWGTGVGMEFETFANRGPVTGAPDVTRGLGSGAAGSPVPFQVSASVRRAPLL
jgi:hypothetical protein